MTYKVISRASHNGKYPYYSYFMWQVRPGKKPVPGNSLRKATEFSSSEDAIRFAATILRKDWDTYVINTKLECPFHFKDGVVYESYQGGDLDFTSHTRSGILPAS